MDLLAFILRVLHTLAEADDCDAVWWRTDGEYAPVTFLVNCNDVFWWATADCERLTPENVDAFEQAYKDVAAVRGGDKWATGEAHLLFCARVRKMRPQGACYKHLDRATWPLFDAAGPERDASEPGNTPRATP